MRVSLVNCLVTFWRCLICLLVCAASMRIPAAHAAELADNGKRIYVALDLRSSSAAGAWRFVSGRWRVGEGVIEQLDERKVGAVALLDDIECSDFEYRMRFLPQRGPGVRAAGPVFRVQGPRTFYYVHFDALSRKAMLVMSTPDQMWNEIRRVTDVPLRLGEWNTARIASDGPAIRVYLNGKLILEQLDDTFLGGGFGLRTSQAHARFKDLVIEGFRCTQSETRSYQPPPFVVVCDDAGAGGDEEFPDVARLSNGELICVFYAGYAHGSRPNIRLPQGGRIAFVKSRDGGRTWSKARTLFDSPFDDRDPSVVEIAPGKLLCNFFSYHYPDHAAGRYATAETFVISSEDYGETWEAEPRRVPSPFDGSCSTSSPVVKLPGGELVMPVYGYMRDRPYHYIPAVVRSKDLGRTWGDPACIVNDPEEPLPEPALARLADGRLVCHMRPVMMQCYSSDGGRTWTRPERLPFRGDAPYLLASSGGVLLSAFRHPGTSIALSRDAGRTWHGPQRLDICLGAYPSLAEMLDGTILCVYYTGGHRSDIRAIRFRPAGNRIEIVSWDRASQ